MVRTSNKLSILFYIGLFLLVLHEILKVYFIMPFPGSQRSNTLQLAFYLNRWTPLFFIIFLAMICIGAPAAGRSKRRWIPFLVMIFALGLKFIIPSKVRADEMFKSPETLLMAARSENKVDTNALVIGVESNGSASAFPIRFLAYHHIIYSTVGGTDVMVTYCDVCHSGRVFDPLLNGHNTKFRLVGMDHFNAMFEDPLTRSWWRQESGECVAGPLKGEKLNEILSMQMTVGEWYRRYPNGKVMQPDPKFIARYDMSGSFEQGMDKSDLTRTDVVSWKEKSLVIGVTIGSASKAYDWNELKKNRVINDTFENHKIIVVANPNGKTFSAFFNHTGQDFTLEGERLVSGDQSFDLNGTSFAERKQLVRLHAYQEFWHSWKTFHPATQTYPDISLP